VGKARYEGLTLAGSTRVAQVQLRGSLDLQNPKNLDSGKLLARRARHHASFGADTRVAGWTLGGEGSGHLLVLDKHTTGDGLVTALQLLAVLKRTGRTLTDLAGIMKKYPQVLVNVHSDNKAGLDDCQPIWDAVAAAEKELNGRGRILVRPSGTEPLVRVMAEAETHELTQRVVDDIVEVVKRELP